MKRISFYFTFILASISCREPQHQIETDGLTELVGSKIPYELGERWRHNYLRSNSGSRTQAICSITRETLVSLTNRLTNYKGMHFTHAVDDGGAFRIIIFPEEGPATTIELAVDASQNSLIDRSVASRWAVRFANSFPQEVRSHFFGSAVIESILAKESFERLEILPAVGDNEEPLLLLYAWNTHIVNNGRSASESVDVYDRANPCPPYCSDQSE